MEFKNHKNTAFDSIENNFGEKIRRASEILNNSTSLMVFTGAGVSARSGIPTFRGDNGFWKKYNPEDLVSVEGFERDPKLVWDWHCMMRKLALSKQPNAGHFAIAEMEKLYKEFLIVTQNIDNFHRRAGSKNIAEIHGNVFFEKCTNCSFRRWSDKIYAEVPKCPRCGNLLRPDVVFFGELLPQKAMQKSLDFARKADSIIVLGTSGVVYPAAQIPYIVIENGGKVIEINTEPTLLTDSADISIFGKSEEILPKIVKYLKMGLKR